MMVSGHKTPSYWHKVIIVNKRKFSLSDTILMKWHRNYTVAG